MRKLQILKGCIDLFYFLTILASGAMLMLFIMVMAGTDMPVTIRSNEVDPTLLAGKILLAFALVAAGFFVYAIHLFRKTITHFTKRDIFNPTIPLYLNRIGICIIASALLTNIPLLFYNAIVRRHINFEFSAGGFDSTFLLISLGLFFMVLSEIFKISRRLKEENELTV